MQRRKKERIEEEKKKNEEDFKKLFDTNVPKMKNKTIQLEDFAKLEHYFGPFMYQINNDKNKLSIIITRKKWSEEVKELLKAVSLVFNEEKENVKDDPKWMRICINI